MGLAIKMNKFWCWRFIWLSHIDWEWCSKNHISLSSKNKVSGQVLSLVDSITNVKSCRHFLTWSDSRFLNSDSRQGQCDLLTWCPQDECTWPIELNTESFSRPDFYIVTRDGPGDIRTCGFSSLLVEKHASLKSNLGLFFWSPKPLSGLYDRIVGL